MPKVSDKQREWTRQWQQAHPEATRAHTRKWIKSYREDHRARGLCTSCDNLPKPGRTRCKDCLAKYQAFKKQLENKRLANSLCIHCSKPTLEGNRLCLKCYLKSVSARHLGTGSRWPELLELWNQQEGRCALSGLPLTLGVNADLDHIIPRSRGGSNDTDNLQWVLESVNTLKRDMLETELFNIVETIYLSMKAKQPERIE